MPIRSEIFSTERFERHAVSLADNHTVVERAPRVVSLLQRLEQDARALSTAYDTVVGDVQANRAITPAAEWIIDNFHVVEAQVRQVRLDLSPGYSRELPKLGPGWLAGHPRVFGIVWAYVAHTDSLVDPDQLARFVRAYESRKPLTIGELWAVAITLRLLLIENLRRLADLITHSAKERRYADEVADRVLAEQPEERLRIEKAIADSESYQPSRAFSVRLLRRLRGQPDAEVEAWLLARLDACGMDPATIVLEEHSSQSSATVTMRNIFRSLRLVSDINWEDWVESVSLIEVELRTNPGYTALDFPTRNMYRSAIERLARKSGQREIDVARAALIRAQHAGDEVGSDVGYWLLDGGRVELAEAIGYRESRRRLVASTRPHPLWRYLATLTLATTGLVGLLLLGLLTVDGGLGTGALVTTCVLAALPLSDLALDLVNYWATRLFRASPLPGLALREGVPERSRTMVAIPTLLSSTASVADDLTQLEVHYLANSDGEVYFALLTDWVDSDSETQEQDEALLEQAILGVKALNERHGEHFVLIHRPRTYNPAEGVWMGWERKRGKLHELSVLLRGEEAGLWVAEGRLPGPFRYVITLDGDTRLPRGAARRLVGKISHPLNRCRLDPVTRRPLRGYGILQPRVAPSLPMSQGSSLVQRVYSIRRGLDPYVFAVSDVYQDLFGEGSFAGKGIYDIDVMHTVQEGRVPENTLLSHDLLEGNYARAGLVTDIEVVEEYPLRYEVSAARTHRWVRGDWQLLPWLLHRRQGISALGLWKMLDNLRRSAVPVVLAAGLPIILAFLPWQAAVAWLAVLALGFFLPPLLPLTPQLLLRREGVTRRSQLRALVGDVADGATLAGLNLVFLGHQAWLTLDAVGRTLYRLVVSRRHLLQWQTAAAADASARDDVGHYVRLMAGGLVFPVLALGVAAARGPAHLAVAAVPSLLWLSAPAVARWASRPTEPPAAELSPDERQALRAIARRTWFFFETFVTATEHHLPPDNFQEDPQPTVARRTSPTNIGLYLLAAVSARDLGWIGLGEASARLSGTLHTLRQLEHYRGHLFNWIDTTTLQPLEPRYVSTVDSGNLAGHLMTVSATCREWVEALDAGTAFESRAAGVQDAVRVLREVLGRVAAEGLDAEQHRRVGDRVAGLERVLDAAGDGHPVSWGPAAAAAGELCAEAALLADPDASEVTAWAGSVLGSVQSLRRDEELDSGGLATLRESLGWCADEAMAAALRMDFGFLFDTRRSLLSIGFHVPSGRLDDSAYDLLASEARLASYLGIAKGDVRTRHWFLLGRPVTAVGGGAALQSWSGSMFEYLMPSLVMQVPRGGLLDTTAQLVVRRQRKYAEELGVPWGISEAAYNARDLAFTYQYSPFGVPGLGIVRGLAEDVVVAPYATGLAAMVDPGAAASNFERLAQCGALGRYGYYESLDFTPGRVPEGADFALVRCYMAHHQGMTIAGIHGALTGGLMRQRFHSEPIVTATELLLQERAPRDVPITHPRREYRDRGRSLYSVVSQPERVFSGSATLAPAVHHLSNGRLSLTLTPAGGGQLRWQGTALTRWHPDPTTEEAGDHIYLRDEDAGRTWSATPLPVRGRAPCQVRMADDRAVFTREQGPYTTELEYHLSPQSDALVRRLVVRNDRRKAAHLTVTSYAELVLAAARDDDAHPVFSKMFVHTEFLPAQSAIIAMRRRRSPSDPEVWAGHRLVVESGGLGPTAVETDRMRFVGRGRTVRSAAQVHRASRVNGSTGYVLDPIFSLSQRLRVPPRGEVRAYFWTFAASSRSELLDLVDQHSSVSAYDRVALLSWTQSQVQLRHLGIDVEEAGLFQTLAGHVVYPHPALRPPASQLARDAGPQSALWPLGISGDLPIVVLRIDHLDDFSVARQLVRAFEYWRMRRFAVDLVLLNDESTTYVQQLHQLLDGSATAIRERTGSPDSTGRIFVVRADQVSPPTLSVLLATARVVLSASRGDLAGQLPPAADAAPLTGATTAPRAVSSGPDAEPQLQPLRSANGLGGFSEDGREYVTVLDAGKPTPVPWSNVVANEQLGFLVTAEGAGHTWWRNSRDNQTTPWRNDPVTATPSEALYVRDDATGAIATPTAAPVEAGRHVAWHGFGYTAFLHETEHLRLDLVQFVPLADPVKVSWLRVTNTGQAPRAVSVTSLHELVLGNSRHVTARHLLTSLDEETGALLVRNPWSTQFADQVVFADLAGDQQSVSGDRGEVLGRQGTLACPDGVASGEPLSGRTGAGLDPCAALQTRFTLGAGETRDVRVLLGAATNVPTARELVRRYRETEPGRVLDEVKAHWADRLERVRVETPDRSFDVVMNGWLMYQTLAGRMYARCGFYQASGAFGFRDQLQDGMAVVLVDPGLAREHLLRAAGRQFVQGDVQHWWLPGDGTGVRTRISDDVVWLSHAVARYVRVTGDTAVLDVEVPYLEGEELADDEHERFFTPTQSVERGSLYEHCVRGIERAFQSGRHGLPLMGTGDWNDGMNRVGAGGMGESVWLGWFLHRTLSDLAPLAASRHDDDFVARCGAEQARLLQALEDNGWDGAWYRRGYFDDGTPLGSGMRPECRIDSIAQSWAVLSGAARGERGLRAMAEVDAQLVMHREGVARLFTPPFDRSAPDPGYIKAYPPGVRENGGQYTHAATWSVLAHAALGQEEKAAALFALVNPVNHTSTPEQVQVYRGEPYVMAADVYSVPPHVGRAGWTWYTGSSGWMYRAGLEGVLGLLREGDSLVVQPCLPPDWTTATVVYRNGEARYRIEFRAPAGAPRRVSGVELDGTRLDGVRIPLTCAAGDHQVRVVLERVAPPS